MTTSINGSGGVTYPDASTQASSQVGMKNRIIDGGFTINQRGYVSGTSLSSGAYAHDRWKAGASGCTYTFTQGALGVNTTITITAGSLIQVIEGCNLPEGGTYVLSWTGTAQARLNGGSYGNSGITITGWTAGTNLNVEFSTGTVGNVQLEKGSTATSFDYRPYGTELQLCQRYFWNNLANQSGGYQDTSLVVIYVRNPVPMRTAPTVTAAALTLDVVNLGAPTIATPSISNTGTTGYRITGTSSSSSSVGVQVGIAPNSNALASSAEL